MELIEKIRERFYTKFIVDSETDCWVWTGGFIADGYPRFKSSLGLSDRATRVSIWIHRGPFDRSLLACHSCDNPSCVNPDHLFLGTNRDNSDDKIRKNRQQVGEDKSSSVLTQKKVRLIRRLHSDRVSTVADISRLFGCSYRTIQKVVNNETWRYDHDQL